MAGVSLPPPPNLEGRRLLSVREPLPRAAQAWAGVLAFVLPLVLWSIVSYVPFVWHPLVLVHHAGDTRVPGTYSYLAAGQNVEREVFEARNRELLARGAKLATGEPVNPVFLP